MTPVSETVLLRRLYWTSFALRFGMGLLALLLTQVYNLPVMEDALYYSYRGSEAAQCWLSGEQSPWLIQAMEEERQAWFMVAMLAVFYCFAGGGEVLPLALGCYCLLTSFTPVLAYRAGRQFGTPRQGALSAARLIAYSPVFLLSSALYKEGLILIALFLFIEHALRLQRSFRLGSVLMLGVCLLALFGLRFYIAAILCVCLVAGLLLGRRNLDAEQAAPAIFRQAFILFVCAIIFSLLGLQEKLERVLPMSLEGGLSQMNASRRDLASAGSGYLREVDVSGVDSSAEFLPVGLAYFLTVPLPWQFGSLRQNLTILETLFWIVLVYPRVFRGIRRAVTANPAATAFLLLFLVTICCLYALAIGNIGTAYRMRAQVWAVFALFAAWGWTRERGKVADIENRLS